MFTEEFEEKILLGPARKNGTGCNHLRIITAFTDAERISSHLIRLADGRNKEFASNIKVDIILGMTRGAGLTEKKHKRLCSLIEHLNGVIGMPKVSCRYIVEGRQVHSKVYIWSKGGQAVTAYCGSVNYTMNAFFVRRECMEVCDAKEAMHYYKSLLKDTINCLNEEATSRLTFATKKNMEDDIAETNLENLSWEQLKGLTLLDDLCVSLLKADGSDTGYGSGVNWGIRRNGYKRDRNQAYIPYNTADRKKGFFPEKNADGTYPVFKVVIKGQGAFYMRQAQAHGKALETPESNAIIGEWLRKILGIPDGTYITKEMLEQAGGTSVRFKKYSEDIYSLEFSGEL